jgi:hypothetical protein
MISTKQKIVYLSAGGATAASLVWLRYAKSAGKARGFLGETGNKVMRTLRSIHGAVDTLQKRTEEIDRFLQEMIDLGRAEKSLAEAVVANSLQRYEQTAQLIKNNLIQSSGDVATLLSDLKSGVKHLVSTPQSSRAA